MFNVDDLVYIMVRLYDYSAYKYENRKQYNTIFKIISIKNNIIDIDIKSKLENKGVYRFNTKGQCIYTDDGSAIPHQDYITIKHIPFKEKIKLCLT